MSNNPVVKMTAFYHPWKDTGTWGKQYLRIDITAYFKRADGSERQYGLREIIPPDYETWSDTEKQEFDEDIGCYRTKNLTGEQFERIRKVYKVLSRRKAFTGRCVYRPGTHDTNLFPYWHIVLERAGTDKNGLERT